MKLILWDIDGTILLAHGAGKRAMERTGRALLGERFDMSQTAFAGCLDPLIVTEAATQSGYTVDGELLGRFRDHYLGELAAELAHENTEVETLPGVAAVLGQLLGHDGLVHGLVTGNYGGAAHHKLRRVDIDPLHFVITGFGDEAGHRRGLVELALARFGERFGRAPDETIVIGDTPHDVDCALAHGCTAIAVATGRFTAEELSSHGAHLVLDDLSDPKPLLDRLLA